LNPQLAEDVRHVTVHGVLADEEALGDVCIGETLGDQ
jgi:hypothetical protein